VKHSKKKKKWVGGDLMKGDFCFFHEKGEKKIENQRRQKINLK